MDKNSEKRIPDMSEPHDVSSSDNKIITLKADKKTDGNKTNYYPVQSRNFKDLFTSNKHRARYITSLFIILVGAIYIFVGSVTTLFAGAHDVKYVNILFFAMNIGLLWLINYEIIHFFRNINFHISLQVFSYVLIIAMYFWPFSFNFHNNYNFFFYDQFKMDWLKWYVNLFIGLGFFGAYLSFCLFSKKINIKDVLMIFWMCLFFTFFIKSLTIFSLNPSYGFSFLIWLILIVIMTDSFAFLGGMAYGKKKFAPKISPHKTIEGVITGFAVGSVLGIAYAFTTYFLADAGQINGSWMVLDSEFGKTLIKIVMYILLSIFLSAIAILSDLFFSWIKRRNNVKDFSNLLPGHGGIIDRVDALSVVCVVMFVLLTLFVGR